MFHNPLDYPFLVTILEESEKIIAEFNSKLNSSLMNAFLNDPLPIIHSHTEHWIKEGGFGAENTGYDARLGTFGAFPLYKVGYPINWYNVEGEFPIIHNLLKLVPNLNFSAFSRLGVDSGLEEHVHVKSNLIFHLCLTNVQGNSVIRCNGEEKWLNKPGDCVLFDYSYPHSSFNFGKADRINLAIDFEINNAIIKG